VSSSDLDLHALTIRTFASRQLKQRTSSFNMIQWACMYICTNCNYKIGPRAFEAITGRVHEAHQTKCGQGIQQFGNYSAFGGDLDLTIWEPALYGEKAAMGSLTRFWQMPASSLATQITVVLHLLTLSLRVHSQRRNAEDTTSDSRTTEHSPVVTLCMRNRVQPCICIKPHAGNNENRSNVPSSEPFS
jgi:hypothetical protein